MSFWCHHFENIISISALKFFVASWGLPGSFLGLPGNLVNNIINKEAYRKHQKLPGSPKEAKKTFRAEIFTIFLLLLWSKRWHQKDILKSTDLYQIPTIGKQDCRDRQTLECNFSKPRKEPEAMEEIDQLKVA